MKVHGEGRMGGSVCTRAACVGAALLSSCTFSTKIYFIIIDNLFKQKDQRRAAPHVPKSVASKREHIAGTAPSTDVTRRAQSTWTSR